MMRGGTYPISIGSRSQRRHRQYLRFLGGPSSLRGQPFSARQISRLPDERFHAFATVRRLVFAACNGANTAKETQPSSAKNRTRAPCPLGVEVCQDITRPPGTVTLVKQEIVSRHVLYFPRLLSLLPMLLFPPVARQIKAKGGRKS